MIIKYTEEIEEYIKEYVVEHLPGFKIIKNEDADKNMFFNRECPIKQVLFIFGYFNKVQIESNLFNKFSGELDKLNYFLIKNKIEHHYECRISFEGIKYELYISGVNQFNVEGRKKIYLDYALIVENRSEEEINKMELELSFIDYKSFVFNYDILFLNCDSHYENIISNLQNNNPQGLFGEVGVLKSLKEELNKKCS